MCVAASGRIVSIDQTDGRKAKVDFAGNILPVDISFVKVKTGDHVLVHAGIAIGKISKKESDELTALLREVEELS
jgi:hydrogenase expression/formation protein HypC